MKLLKDSQDVVEYILPNYNKCLLKQYKVSTYNNKSSKLLKILYSFIYKIKLIYQILF